MTMEYIMPRVVTGATLILAFLLGAYIAKFLLFPLVVAMLAVAISFFIGDWVFYFIEHKEEIIEKFKAAIK